MSRRLQWPGTKPIAASHPAPLAGGSPPSRQIANFPGQAVPPEEPHPAEFAANHVWLALSGIAQTLACWAQVLLLDGELRVAEPKTLRYRLWHAAGRITRHARRWVLHLPATWPWAAHLVRAFARLRALPAG